MSSCMNRDWSSLPLILAPETPYGQLGNQPSVRCDSVNKHKAANFDCQRDIAISFWYSFGKFMTD